METKNETKKENLKPKSKVNWGPIATDLGFMVCRGLITGFSMQAGIMIYDKTFGRRENNLVLINSRKEAISA